MAEMHPEKDEPDSPTCCAPGDVTVTQIYTGYLIGRALEPKGQGPWWEFVAVVKEEALALHQAATIARIHGVRAWRDLGAENYKPILLGSQ